MLKNLTQLKPIIHQQKSRKLDSQWLRNDNKMVRSEGENNAKIKIIFKKEAIMAPTNTRAKRTCLTTTILPLLFPLIIFLPTAAGANNFETCDYNGKMMQCKRSFKNGVVKLTWQDGVTDHYQLVKRTTNTTSEWRDSRGGLWNSLAYAGNLILVNQSNKNTIIIGGTRTQCLHNWRLGKICTGN